MKLNTQGRYAVTAMLDLVFSADDAPCSLQEISARQGVSRQYLEQIFARLRSRKLVASVRGPGGGYKLAQPPHAITVADIVEAVDEEVNITRCGGRGDCHNGEICLTHHLWEDLGEQIRSFLSGITLADLVARDEMRLIAARQQQRSYRQVLPAVAR